MALTKLDEWLKSKKIKQKQKMSPLERLEFDIEFTTTEIIKQQRVLYELEKDLVTFNKLKDLIKDKEFKNEREYAKYLLSLDGDIMKDYERVYGEK